jgi:hypothetical protein
MISKQLIRLSSLAVAAGVVACGCGSKSSGSETRSSSEGVKPDAGTAPVTMAPAPTMPGGALPPNTGLPDLPLMTHVQALVQGNSASITFDPVSGAKDYRVYLLPQTSDVRLNADGSLAGVTNAVYRCAGLRAAPTIWVDEDQGPPSNPIPNWVAVNSLVDKEDVQGFRRALANATIGYGFEDPVPGTVAIYGVGDPSASADNYGYGIREMQTRTKMYVQDNTTYLAKGWRDDGVVFYALSSASSTACGTGAPVAIYTKNYTDDIGTSTVYYAAGPESMSRGTSSLAFYLCPTQATGSQPIMRAYNEINSPGGTLGKPEGHDELAVGSERFARARCQGSNFDVCASSPQSLWQVHWANIQGPTQLVVEALDAGCPLQGLFGATSTPATKVNGDDNGGDNSLLNDPIFTLAQLQSKAANGEVFLNGTFDGSPTPHPIARALVTVSPQTRPTMDFSSNFAGPPEQFAESFDGNGDPNCGYTPTLMNWADDTDTCDGAHLFTSPTYNVLFFDVQDQRYSVGQTEGELWTGFSARVAGKFRISPKGATATMSASTFLHAAMEVTSFSTGRRYPQIMISEQDFVTSQWLLERGGDQLDTHIGSTMILQPIDSGLGRPVAELELCSQRGWQVNDQCPWFLLEKNDPPNVNDTGINNPHPDLFDRLQDDRSTRWDLYTSTSRAYIFIDSLPYACVDFTDRKATTSDGKAIAPTPVPPKAGTVTVSFGDVQYHAGAESDAFTIYSPFHLEHELFESTRHYDYIGFKSNEPAPAWDEGRFPCITQMYSGGTTGTQTPESGD